MRRLCVLILVLLLPCIVMGLWVSPGMTVYSFLYMGGGARAMGTGYVWGIMADSPMAIFWNPAGVCLASPKTLFTSYENQLGLHTINLAYVHSLSNFPLGLGLIGSFPPPIVETNEYGEELGEFYPMWMAPEVAVAYPVYSLGDRIVYAGGGLKLVYENLHTAWSMGVGVDFGVMYRDSICLLYTSPSPRD